MRTTVLTVGVVAFVAGVWLAVRSPGVESERSLASTNVTVGDALPQSELTAVTGNTAATGSSETLATGVPERGEISLGSPPSQIPPSPPKGTGLHGAFVDYLVESGLSQLDGERIADEAVGGLNRCRASAFSGGIDAEKHADLLACNQNVLQEHGLIEAISRLERERRNGQ